MPVLRFPITDQRTGTRTTPSSDDKSEEPTDMTPIAPEPMRLAGISAVRSGVAYALVNS
jgi:hypothetical protein